MAAQDGTVFPLPEIYTALVGSAIIGNVVIPAPWMVEVPPTPVTPPVVSNLEPPAGALVKPDTPISFDITDTEGFVLIIPMISLDAFTAPEPTTNNLESFEPLYAASTRTTITNGYHYVLRRRGGWTATPTLIIWAVDIYGNIYTG